MMPELTEDCRPDVPPDRRPIFEEMGPHPYEESEFPRGKGHCSHCGGGPEAKIHNFVDPQERIADALERIATFMENRWR